MARKTKFRPTKKVVIIVSEGAETEPIYFRNFKNKCCGTTIQIHPGKGADPIGLVKMAKYLKNEICDGVTIERIYCVYDVNSTPERSLISAEKEASKNGITTCVSNPCFELWYLLHFKYTTANFCSYNVLKDELLRYIPEYEKNRDVYRILLPNQQKAISHAERLEQYHRDENTSSSIRECNPSTCIYELVRYLNSIART